VGFPQLRISADVTKHADKPAVVDWGRRFQAWFGSYGGKMEPFFVFTTDVSRTDIDKAIQDMGVRSRRQIPMDKVEEHTGLKATTTPADYLDGDPVIVTIRFIKDGNVVEAALEDFIQEKIMVDGKEVVKHRGYEEVGIFPYRIEWCFKRVFDHGCSRRVPESPELPCKTSPW
jgi:hypothetical protein